MVSREQELQIPAVREGLRSRKKRRTRLAIKEAAAQLFSERGYEATTVEDIAALAEVSATTFFRYFTSKDKVVFSEAPDRLPTIRRIILEQPTSTCDLEAVRIALQAAIAIGEEPSQLAQYTRAVSSSYTLRGKASEAIDKYEQTIGAALAERGGLPETDDAIRLTAAVTMTALEQAWRTWEREGRRDLAAAIDKAFELLRTIAPL